MSYRQSNRHAGSRPKYLLSEYVYLCFRVFLKIRLQR